VCLHLWWHLSGRSQGCPGTDMCCSGSSSTSCGQQLRGACVWWLLGAAGLLCTLPLDAPWLGTMVAVVQGCSSWGQQL
jgi:hypothetical protein